MTRDLLVIVAHCAVDAHELGIWRDAARNLLQEGRPVKAALDHGIEHFGRVDDGGEFFRLLLRRGYIRLDLRPIVLHRAQAIFHTERLVGFEHVEEQHQGTDRTDSHHAELERIALALPLFRDLFVEEI